MPCTSHTRIISPEYPTCLPTCSIDSWPWRGKDASSVQLHHILPRAAAPFHLLVPSLSILGAVRCSGSYLKTTWLMYLQMIPNSALSCCVTQSGCRLVDLTSPIARHRQFHCAPPSKHPFAATFCPAPPFSLSCLFRGPASSTQ